jgi:hypothetical protein
MIPILIAVVAHSLKRTDRMGFLAFGIQALRPMPKGSRSFPFLEMRLYAGTIVPMESGKDRDTGCGGRDENREAEAGNRFGKCIWNPA